MKKSCIAIFILLCIFIISLKNYATPEQGLIQQNENILKQLLIDAHIPQYQYQIIHTYPHDRNSFTEGLFFQNGYMYESSGLYGQSKIRMYTLNNTKPQKEYRLEHQYFGEGMTLLGDALYQLTYREHIGFIYDKNTLQLQNTFSYSTEGWGLTSNDGQLIMSNGSAILTFIDPHSMKPIRYLSVNAAGRTIHSLNELEYINGMIYANIWPTSIIVIISPENGNVRGWIDIHALKPKVSCLECVANGIAYNKDDNTLFVTGKNWPLLSAIKIYLPQRLS